MHPIHRGCPHDCPGAHDRPRDLLSEPGTGPRQNVSGPYRSDVDEVARLERERLVIEERLASLREPRRRTARRRVATALRLLGVAMLTLTTLGALGAFGVTLEENRLLNRALRREIRERHAETLAARLSAFHARDPGLGRWVTRIAEDVWDVDRRFVREGRLGALWSGLAAAPHHAGGALLGVTLEDDALAPLGLRRGDVVIAIDGVVLDEAALASAHSIDPAHALETETRVEVAILRRGEPHTLTYLLR